jgi:hypothetical protein
MNSGTSDDEVSDKAEKESAIRSVNLPLTAFFWKNVIAELTNFRKKKGQVGY